MAYLPQRHRPSFFDHKVECERAYNQKQSVKSHKKRNPALEWAAPLYHGRRRFNRGDHCGNQHREKQQRQHHLAGPGVGGYRGEERANGGDGESCKHSDRD